MERGVVAPIYSNSAERAKKRLKEGERGGGGEGLRGPQCIGSGRERLREKRGIKEGLPSI